MNNQITILKRICVNCNRNYSVIDSKKHCEKWYKYKEGYICHTCYTKLFTDPKRRLAWNAVRRERYGPKRITYKNTRIVTTIVPRTGQCSNCNKRIGDEYINSRGKVAIIKKTDLHHIQYHDNDFLKDTIELCVSCHMKETRNKKKVRHEL